MRGRITNASIKRGDSKKSNNKNAHTMLGRERGKREGERGESIGRGREK